MKETQCDRCGAWVIAEFTFHQLCDKWKAHIGGKLTDGYEKRFRREGVRLGIPWEEVILPFKYCAQGKLTRFYIVKGPADTKAKKQVLDCPQFFMAGLSPDEFPVPSPLWTVCLTESHGPATVKGQLFVPGLCENRVYFRLPAHGKIEPERVREGTCDVCSQAFAQGLVVTEITRFCCNKHYLQWWKKKHPEEYRKFNGPCPEDENPSHPLR